MKGSYSVPTGSSRSPLIACDRPSAESMMNRFISAMPSSMCCPFGEKSQLKVEGIFSCRNRSCVLGLREQPAPVDPGAEIGRHGHVGRRGDDARGQFGVAAREFVEHQPKALLRRHLRRRLEGEPFAAPRSRARSGAGGLRALNGASARNASSVAGSCDRPSNLSHSWPGRMFCAARHFSICATVIRPAWLSLWPWIGRPTPLMV